MIRRLNVRFRKISMQIASSGFGGFLWHWIQQTTQNHSCRAVIWKYSQSHGFEISRDFMIMYFREVNQGIELPLCVTCNTVFRLLQSGWSINTSWLLQRYWLHLMSQCQWSNLEGYDYIYPSIKQQGKSEGFESCDRPIVRKRPISVMFCTVWPWNLMDDLGKQ